MEILSIWTPEYRGFKEQGFNFSSEFIFDYNLDYNLMSDSKVKGTIKIKKNPNYIDNLFGKTNIENITAIIGQNGTGKSSILSLLSNKLSEGLSAGTDDIIIVYSNGKGVSKKYSLFYPENWKIKIENTAQLEMTAYTYNNNILDTNLNDRLKFKSNLSNLNFIFYSFFIDNDYHKRTFAGNYDVSTSYYLNEESQTSGSAIDKKDQSNFSLNQYLSWQIEMVAEFITSDFSKKYELPFQLPESIYFNFDNSYYKYILNNLKANSEFPLFLKALKSKIDTIEKGLFIENFKGRLAFYLLVNVLYKDVINSKEINPKLIKLFNEINQDKTVYSIVTDLLYQLPNITIKFKGEEIGSKPYERLSKNSLKLLNLFNDSQLTESTEQMIFNSSQVSINTAFRINKNTLYFFKKFIQAYNGIKELSNFISFHWAGISTGEESFLMFMSRFYNLNHHRAGSDLSKNLVILIDEGDAGFHPEWQKQFFSHSLDFLSSLFKEHQIQILYTANTPFLVSDLPKDHIIFLKKNEEGANIVNINGQKLETFGGNIHQLFSDSMFMSKPLIGKFAQIKIDALIKRVKNDYYEKNENDRKLIELIGEPVIKNRLLEIWNDKFGIEEELEYHRRMIEKLENQQNDKNSEN